ncbi:hypothetical protein PMIN06_013145 [Paraphaeosphaeria minitans]
MFACRIRSFLFMALAREDPIHLSPVFWALPVRCSMRALAVGAAQVALLPAHVARFRPHAFACPMSEPSALEAGHRRARLLERRHHDAASAKRHTVRPEQLLCLLLGRYLDHRRRVLSAGSPPPEPAHRAHLHPILRAEPFHLRPAYLAALRIHRQRYLDPVCLDRVPLGSHQSCAWQC